MNLVELHRNSIKKSFPSHRIESFSVVRDTIPLYTIGSMRSAGFAEGSPRRVLLKLSNLSFDEVTYINNLPAGKRLSFDHIFSSINQRISGNLFDIHILPDYRSCEIELTYAAVEKVA